MPIYEVQTPDGRTFDFDCPTPPTDADIAEMMGSGRCKVNDLILLVLETLYRSMGFSFATVCIKDIKSN